MLRVSFVRTTVRCYRYDAKRTRKSPPDFYDYNTYIFIMLTTLRTKSSYIYIYVRTYVYKRVNINSTAENRSENGEVGGIRRDNSRII